MSVPLIKLLQCLLGLQQEVSCTRERGRMVIEFQWVQQSEVVPMLPEESYEMLELVGLTQVMLHVVSIAWWVVELGTAEQCFGGRCQPEHI